MKTNWVETFSHFPSSNSYLNLRLCLQQVGCCFLKKSFHWRCQDVKTLLQSVGRSQSRWFRHPHPSSLSSVLGALGDLPRETGVVRREKKKNTLCLPCCHHSPDLKYLENWWMFILRRSRSLAPSYTSDLFFLTTYEGGSVASGLLAERYRLFRGLCT